jgi:hypothetical protein
MAGEVFMQTGYVTAALTDRNGAATIRGFLAAQS